MSKPQRISRTLLWENKDEAEHNWLTFETLPNQKKVTLNLRVDYGWKEDESLTVKMNADALRAIINSASAMLAHLEELE